VNRFY